MIPRLNLAVAAAAVCLAMAGAGFAQAPSDVLPDGPGKDVVVRVCTSCHEASQITYKPRTPEGWEYMIGRMMDAGAELTGEEQAAVQAYLVKNFGVTDAPAPGPAPAGGAAGPSGR